jgi:peptide/nickel transport system permease protein
VTARAFIQRLGGMAFVVLGVTAITFVISHLIPGDPAQLLAGPRASAEALARIRAHLGLDQPLPVQYGRYLWQLVHGDFGESIMTGRPVLQDMASVFPATLELIGVAFTLSVLAGAGLGVAAAVRRDRPLDYAARLIASVSISVPAFWLALVLLLVFYGVFGVLPGDGRLGVDFDPPRRLTGFYLVDSLLTGDWPVFADALRHIALPALTLALVSLGTMIRITRSSMIEVLNEDYIRTAAASGLPRRTIIFRHALRNALTPLVTVIGLEAAALLFGAVVVETVFVWPGAGSYVLGAILALDFPVIMGFTVVVSIAYVLINTIVDLLCRALNPQLREAAG